MGVHYNSGGWLAPDLMCGCTTDGFQVGKRQRVVHVIIIKEPGRINISEQLSPLCVQP